MAIHSVLACAVEVTRTSAGECLVALGAVLRLVADDDFLAVSACPVHGTYPSTGTTHPCNPQELTEVKIPSPYTPPPLPGAPTCTPDRSHVTHARDTRAS